MDLEVWLREGQSLEEGEVLSECGGWSWMGTDYVDFLKECYEVVGNFLACLNFEPRKESEILI